MRLGQLARKLDIETSEIIKYLGEKNIQVDNHLNTKLEDDTVTLVLNAFTPKEESKPVVKNIEQVPQETVIEEPTTIVEEVVVEKEDITPDPVEATEEVNTAETPTEKEAFTVSELRIKQETEEKENEERQIVELSREDKVPEDLNVAVIRAPKVELQGIKVLGKIELPEKVKKESKQTSTEAVDNSENKLPSDKTESTSTAKDGKHPNKKKLKTKTIIIPDSDIKKEEEGPQKPKKAKEIKAEKKAKEKAVKKKKSTHRQEELSERQKIREKRKKQREKQKETPKKKQKSWLKQLWDAIK